MIEILDKGYIIGRGYYVIIDNKDNYNIDIRILSLYKKEEDKIIPILRIEGTMTLMVHPTIKSRLALFISEENSKVLNIGDKLYLKEWIQ